MPGVVSFVPAVEFSSARCSSSFGRVHHYQSRP
jgi:hypothetical protein